MRALERQRPGPESHPEISGSRRQAGTAEVRNWALNAYFEIGVGSIPEQAITVYNQAHPDDHPY